MSTQIDDVVLVSADDNAVAPPDPFSIRPGERCAVGARRREVVGGDVSIVPRGDREETATTTGASAAPAAAR